MSIRNVLDLSFDPACLATPGGKLLYVNDPFQDALGIGPGDAESVSLAELLGQAGFTEMARQAGQGVSLFKRLKILSKDGNALPVEVHCLRLPGTGELAVVFRPTAGNMPSEGAEHMALHDALTGLPNRVLLLDRMRQTLARAKRHKDFVAVVFVDLDGFKPINDTYGHKCGDEVLKATAARLLEAVRSDDTAARIGGDEFVMILGELRNGLHAGLMGNRVIKSITQPIAWQDREVSVSASLGISVAPTDGTDPDELLKKADDAMYVAKKSGKNGYSFYNESSYFK